MKLPTITITSPRAEVGGLVLAAGAWGLWGWPGAALLYGGCMVLGSWIDDALDRLNRFPRPNRSTP